ncbi:MAG: cytochrome B, partial [Sphingobium sp.]
MRRPGATIPALMPLLMTASCAGPLSTLDAAGPAASDIATLWWVMLGGAALLTLLVLTLLALPFSKGRAARKGGTKLWLGALGLAMPAAVLTVLLGYALMLGERTIARPAPDVVTVEATARQWVWTFRTPSGAESQGTLHIPAGRPIDVRLASADVIHSFWVPRLGGKMDAIPGQVNVLRIQADAPGVYQGVCAEFCGLDHT